MNTIERKYEYTLKQYRREGFGRSYYFIDIYLNTRLEQSIMIGQMLSDDELKRFFNVAISRLNKGNNVDFLDSTERRMNQLFAKSKYNLSELEHTLALKMGKERFEIHYEKNCYYLVFASEDAVCMGPETFGVSEQYSPLSCLKMAHQLAQAKGVPYRILLSDEETEVDTELLAFALSEE